MDHIVGAEARMCFGTFTKRFFHRRALECDWGHIPVELLKKIFEYCPTSVCSIRQVNRHWRNSSYESVKSLQLDFLSPKIEIFPNVTNLVLSEVSVQPCNQDLALLSRLPKLQALSLFACRLIDGRGLLHLRCLDQLKVLDLREWHQSDDDLAPISCLGSLKCLQLSGCSGLTDQALVHIGHLRNLQRLDLSRCDNIAFQAPTACCLSKLTQLTTLYLSRVGRLSNLSAEVIGSLSSLVALKINNNNIDDLGILQLSRLTRLQIFKANHTCLRDEGVQHLKNLRKLQRIHLKRCQISDQSLRVLAEIPNLLALCVEGNQFSSQGVFSLKALKNLKELSITHTPNLSFTVFEALTGLTSLCIFPSYNLNVDAALNNHMSMGLLYQNGLEQNLCAQQRIIRNLPFLKRLNGLQLLPIGPEVEGGEDKEDLYVKNAASGNFDAHEKSVLKVLKLVRKLIDDLRTSALKLVCTLVTWIANSLRRIAQAANLQLTIK